MEILMVYLLKCHLGNKMAFKDGLDDWFLPGPLLGSYVWFGYGINDVLIFGLSLVSEAGCKYDI